jgi:hypothetical protein
LQISSKKTATKCLINPSKSSPKFPSKALTHLRSRKTRLFREGCGSSLQSRHRSTRLKLVAKVKASVGTPPRLVQVRGNVPRMHSVVRKCASCVVKIDSYTFSPYEPLHGKAPDERGRILAPALESYAIRLFPSFACASARSCTSGVLQLLILPSSTRCPTFGWQTVDQSQNRSDSQATQPERDRSIGSYSLLITAPDLKSPALQSP